MPEGSRFMSLPLSLVTEFLPNASLGNGCSDVHTADHSLQNGRELLAGNGQSEWDRFFSIHFAAGVVPERLWG